MPVLKFCCLLFSLVKHIFLQMYFVLVSCRKFVHSLGKSGCVPEPGAGTGQLCALLYLPPAHPSHTSAEMLTAKSKGYQNPKAIKIQRVFQNRLSVFETRANVRLLDSKKQPFSTGTCITFHFLDLARSQASTSFETFYQHFLPVGQTQISSPLSCAAQLTCCTPELPREIFRR